MNRELAKFLDSIEPENITEQDKENLARIKTRLATYLWDAGKVNHLRNLVDSWDKLMPLAQEIKNLSPDDYQLLREFLQMSGDKAKDIQDLANLAQKRAAETRKYIAGISTPEQK